MKAAVIILFLSTVFMNCTEKEKEGNNSNYIDKQSQPVIDDFFKKVQIGNFKLAIDDLLKSNENINMEDSTTINMRDKFIGINASSGRFESKRLIRQKSLEDDVAVYSYLVKYERKFYRFIFIFYNNGQQVKIFKFSFDDSLDSELETAIKLYM